MPKNIPSFCKSCIQRLQKECQHIHTTTNGAWHFSQGETWDDISEVCDDCGAEVTYSHPWYTDQQEIPF